jgi:Holliday junction resolvasome RuvABC endonuclease subunit
MEITLPYRIFAVDPATGKSGWAVLDVISLNPLQINIVAHGQIDGDKLVKTRKEMSLIFQRQFCIVDALYYTYHQLITENKPNIVASEGAFGYSHMSAFLAISLAIHELRRATKDVLGQDITTVPPTISKLAFTGKGGADKDLMRWAYRTLDYLNGKVLDEAISEHEIDAIAHGVAHVFRDILKTVVQLTGKEKKAAKLERKKKTQAKKESTG